MGRLYAACEVLRKIIRFVYLSRKLKGHISNGTKELALAASVIQEIEFIKRESDLSGIEVVDIESKWIVRAAQDISQNSSRILLQGIETQVKNILNSFFRYYYILKTLMKYRIKRMYWLRFKRFIIWEFWKTRLNQF